jgi:hypothetical protein
MKAAHAALDTAVLTAYGVSPKRDLLSQLLTLNQQVAERIEKGDAVTAPGVAEVSGGWLEKAVAKWPRNRVGI